MTLDLVSLASLLGATSLIYLASTGLAVGPSRLTSRLFTALALVAAWSTLTLGAALTISLGWDARLCYASRLFSGFLGPLLFLFTLAYLGRLERWSNWWLLVLLPGLAATTQFLLIFTLVPEAVVRASVLRSLGGEAGGLSTLYPWFGPLLVVQMLQQYGFAFASIFLFLSRARGTGQDASQARVLAVSYVLFVAAVTATNLLPLFRGSVDVTAARLTPLLSVPFLFVLHGFLRRGTASLERLTAEREALLAYLPVAVDRMLPSAAGAIEPPSDAAIVFTDLRGFTSLNERLDPATVLRWLDGFFARMSEAILGEGGTVDKLLGDGVLAVFGVTEPLDNPSAAAFRAAQRMQRGLGEINRSAPIQPGIVLRMGVGIHRGPVVAASLGGGARKTYTVVGDVVNTAQRIEALTKTTGYPILVSRAVHASLAPADQRNGILLGPFELPGKEKRVDLFGYDWPPPAV